MCVEKHYREPVGYQWGSQGTVVLVKSSLDCRQTALPADPTFQVISILRTGIVVTKCLIQYRTEEN